MVAKFNRIMLLAIEKITTIRNECLPSILKSIVNKRRESENTNT